MLKVLQNMDDNFFAVSGLSWGVDQEGSGTKLSVSHAHFSDTVA